MSTAVPSPDASLEGADRESGPYRTPPPPCLDCEARKEAAKGMQPFVEDDRRCPECRAGTSLMWQGVCRGSGSFIVTTGKRGFWFIRWWGRVAEVTFKCKVEKAPKHFHFQCRTCQHRWMMLTATEMPKTA